MEPTCKLPNSCISCLETGPGIDDVLTFGPEGSPFTIELEYWRIASKKNFDHLINKCEKQSETWLCNFR